MSYDKAQATREFKQWSVAYDQSILQRLLFGPAHRAIISRLQARSVGRPMTLLDVGCGTGVFAARLAAAMPRATIWGMDLVDSMLIGGRERWQVLRDRGASPGSAFVLGFWLASPRATRGQGHHPEFCWLSRASGTNSGRLAPYNSASRALNVNTRYASIGWVKNGRARTAPIGFVVVVQRVSTESGNPHATVLGVDGAAS
jgi:SAM-dependent methyltransferase